jgi:hypothetical protein
VKLDDRAASDFRATLSTGAAIFLRGDYKFVADGAAEETCWLLGANGLAKLDRIVASEPAKRSIGFEESGYYVLRNSWKPNANYMFFDCGHHGADNCGHAHADALSFELAVNGRTVLVDPGTYTYTASKEMRDSFRSSAAHNTLTLDDESWSIPAGPFSWKTIGHCQASRWISKERFDYIAATQDRSGGSIVLEHSREVLFLKNHYWVVRDRVDSPGAHGIKLWFHFDSSVAPLRNTDHTIRVISENGPGAGLQLATFADGGEWIQESGWVSHCYGVKEEGPVCVFSVQSNGPAELITFLIPEMAAAGAKPFVREFEALEGRAFEINVDNKHDVLLFPSFGGQIETARFASDFEIAWLRFANERAQNPEEFVLIGGETVELDGHILLKSTRTIEYVSASSVGDRFRVETDEGELEISLPVLDLESLFADLNQQSAT